MFLKWDCQPQMHSFSHTYIMRGKNEGAFTKLFQYFITHYIPFSFQLHQGISHFFVSFFFLLEFPSLFFFYPAPGSATSTFTQLLSSEKVIQVLKPDAPELQVSQLPPLDCSEWLGRCRFFKLFFYIQSVTRFHNHKALLFFLTDCGDIPLLLLHHLPPPPHPTPHPKIKINE